MKIKKSYPFASKGSILAVIATDDVFAVECLQIMYARQTAFEQETLSTVSRNRQGFMSSHAVNGTKLARKSLAEGLTALELDQARGIVCRYGKQLAAHFRAEAIGNDPSLAETAKLFSC